MKSLQTTKISCAAVSAFFVVLSACGDAKVDNGSQVNAKKGKPHKQIGVDCFETPYAPACKLVGGGGGTTITKPHNGKPY